jgi:ubiquinone biosynthesis protein
MPWRRDGARMPKELMLFVKDVDIFQEITYLATYFATQHGDRIARDVGTDPRQVELDLDGMRASMGLPPGTSGIIHRELQERRELIRKRMEERRSRSRR